ncbi:GAF domain-containing protein [Sinobaca sp. H24]|uniref:sensor domain-containing diguanylate cyclase n=1 Tax=Sinobaca sp. H24 TaxID=2923376 RepID=UPI00207A9ACC|nr:GAF domain-containing protein [Sinobaca sp. H24]
MMALNFPNHTIFFATNDKKMNVIRKVLDQAALCIPEGKEDPYQESFCHLAVEAPNKNIIIPDLTKHSFTKEHRFTKQAGSGSFMGAAVTSGDGEALGTLCLVSNHTAVFSEEQVTLLQGYAYIIARALEVEQSQMRDSLTGLYLSSALPSLFENKKEDYTSWSTLYINLRGTRIFNELYGFEMGNLRLQKTAKMLYEAFPAGSLFARAAQDKFIVMLPFTANENPRMATELYTEKLLQHLKEAPCVINKEHHTFVLL